jgi:hypothetical protein
MPFSQGRALRGERELRLQEGEVRGEVHGAIGSGPWGSELALEGAGLQGGEERVEFFEVRALAGLLLLDGFDDGGEAVLEVEGGDGKI